MKKLSVLGMLVAMNFCFGTSFCTNPAGQADQEPAWGDYLEQSEIANAEENQKPAFSQEALRKFYLSDPSAYIEVLNRCKDSQHIIRHPNKKIQAALRAMFSKGSPDDHGSDLYWICSEVCGNLF
jgi:hypothetical protein